MDFSLRVLSAGIVLILLAAARATFAQTTPIAFTNARILTAAGPAAEFERGTLLVKDGKILALGDAGAVTIPADCTTIDCVGKTIIPGLVDTHSHIGGVAGGDGSATLHPDVRVLDSINPLDSGFRRAVAGGLTTLNIMPGSGHLMSGQTIYVKLRKAKTIEEMVIRDSDGAPMGGLKMANGTNPMREPPFASTRGKAAALVRELFVKARQYKDKREKALQREGAGAGEPADGKQKPMPPDRDLGLETIVEVLDGRRMVHHHTHRADDIMTVLRLQKEFGFRVTLHHVSEAWKVADEIAEAGVACSAILVDSPGGKLEAAELYYETAGVLERAGVKVALHTDDWITDARLFLRMAALAVRAGMSREGAMMSLTIRGAEIMDLADRVGSLEPGKDADLLILSGDPFSVYTKVEQTWIEGVKVFDRSNPEDLLYAQGGYGAGSDRTPYLCCAGSSAGFAFGRSGVQWGAAGVSSEAE